MQIDFYMFCFPIFLSYWASETSQWGTSFHPEKVDQNRSSLRTKNQDYIWIAF